MEITLDQNNKNDNNLYHFPYKDVVIFGGENFHFNLSNCVEKGLNGFRIFL